ncbi:MAG: endonuclease/exonuclease/phosphatase family protein [Gammaproteobacteria bacterium]|nr:endonuclease/exonuclease/phosphatase family protein [Gammaproteobacteria bacterium]
MSSSHPTSASNWYFYFTRRLTALTLLLSIAAFLGQFGEFYWIFDLFTHFTWHYFLAGLMLAVSLFLLGKPGWALLAAALALFHYPQIYGNQKFLESPCAGESEGGELRVLQFNVGSSNDRVDKFAAWLNQRSTLPEVIVLLEATEKLESTVVQLQATGWPIVLAEYRRDNYGIVVASSLEHARLSLESVGDPYLPTIVVSGRTNQKSIPFTLMAVHPPPPLTKRLAASRNSQFSGMVDWLKRDGTRHQIIAGDLNATPWSPWFRKLLDSSGLRDAQQGKSHGGTFPTYGLPSILALPLDHTLVSEGIRVLEREIGPGFSLGSDHRLVESRLLLSRCLQPG